MKGECGLAPRPGSEDLDDAATGIPSDAEGIVEGDGAGCNDADGLRRAISTLHDGPLSKCLFDTGNDASNGLKLFSCVHVHLLGSLDATYAGGYGSLASTRSVGMGSELDSVVAGLLDVARDPRPGPEPMSSLLQRVLEVIQGATEADLNRALTDLVRGLHGPQPQVGGHVAWACGCLVEQGADAETLCTALLDRLPRALDDARRFVDAVAPLPEEEPDGTKGCYVRDRYVSQPQLIKLLQEDPVAAQSFTSLDGYCKGLIAAFSAAPHVLKEAGPSLRETLSGMDDVAEYTYFLDRLLRVPMDEQWFIIDAIHDRGFVVDVTGVANAFQVYALLHDVLTRGPGGASDWSAPVTLPAPSPEVVDVARGRGAQSAEGVYIPSFTLFRWTAVSKARRVPDSGCVNEWYCMSAIPAELARFEGRRVGVIGEFNVQMEFSIAREFGRLTAGIELRDELPRSEVDRLMDAFTKTPDPGHPAPGVGWP